MLNQLSFRNPTNYIFFIFMSLSISTAIFAQSGNKTSYPALPLGEVNGLVKGGPKAVLTFQGKNTVRKATANQEGYYEIQLPLGLYSISVELPNHFPFLRAPFRLRSGTKTVINIAPVWRVREIATVVDPQAHGLRDIPTFAPAPKYARPLGRAHGQNLDLLIQYNSSRSEGVVTVYKDSVVSYDELTIYADTVRFNNRSLQLEAEDNVTVEEGGQSNKVRRALVTFNSGKPVVVLTRAAIDRVKGDGSINGGEGIFKFDVGMDGSGFVSYENKRLGINFTSVKIDDLKVLSDAQNKVKITGAGSLGGRVPENLKYMGNVPVSFTLILQSERPGGIGGSLFSIDFQLKGFQDTGRINAGGIQFLRN